MLKLFESLCWLGLAISVVALTITSLPSLGGSHVGGNMLLAHMMASGVLVFTLPLLAVFGVGRMLGAGEASPAQKISFWVTIATGFLTILTVFVCMLPIPSTETMHTLALLHRYAGFAMVPAVVLFLISAWQFRRMNSMRSSTPG
ncbi:hypothetical protein Q31b_29420 [Novipirellula aureliae]|uniref:DUF4405 domain-containing protein n=1 Tax=Novipirellula aureliae TaxID=2527966 RepID=A0A5C6DVS4_9BACT|nr:hypothetical protein [Novipirellula aureliae]TWU41493.1 hypothetical protein Q31b_29420 [Novipirellula aureliae]